MLYSIFVFFKLVAVHNFLGLCTASIKLLKFNSGDRLYRDRRLDTPGPFLRIFQWRGQLRKGTSGRKGKVKKYSLLGGLGSSPRNFCIFELPRLDLLQFQHDFRSFSDKKGHY